jgi:hypothetical protein
LCLYILFIELFALDASNPKIGAKLGPDWGQIGARLGPDWGQDNSENCFEGFNGICNLKNFEERQNEGSSTRQHWEEEKASAGRNREMRRRSQQGSQETQAVLEMQRQICVSFEAPAVLQRLRAAD